MLLPSQIAKVRRLHEHDTPMQDIITLTGYDRIAIKDALGLTNRHLDAERRRRASNRRQLEKLRSERPIGRSVEEHEQMLRGCFPELFVE